MMEEWQKKKTSLNKSLTNQRMTKDKEFFNELVAIEGPVNFAAKIFTTKKREREMGRGR